MSYISHPLDSVARFNWTKQQIIYFPSVQKVLKQSHVDHKWFVTGKIVIYQNKFETLQMGLHLMGQFCNFHYFGNLWYDLSPTQQKQISIPVGDAQCSSFGPGLVQLVATLEVAHHNLLLPIDFVYFGKCSSPTGTMQEHHRILLALTSLTLESPQHDASWSLVSSCGVKRAWRAYKEPSL